MAMKKAIMNDKHIIKMAMAVSGCDLKKVAEKTGTSYANAYNKIHKSEGVISLYTLYSVLHEMGFDIVIRDHDKQYGGVEYTLMEKQDGDGEWEKRLEHELVDAKHHVSTVNSMTKDGQIKTVQVVNALPENAKDDAKPHNSDNEPNEYPSSAKNPIVSRCVQDEYTKMRVEEIKKKLDEAFCKGD